MSRAPWSAATMPPRRASSTARPAPSSSHRVVTPPTEAGARASRSGRTPVGLSKSERGSCRRPAIQPADRVSQPPMHLAAHGRKARGRRRPTGESNSSSVASPFPRLTGTRKPAPLMRRHLVQRPARAPALRSGGPGGESGASAALTKPLVSFGSFERDGRLERKERWSYAARVAHGPAAGNARSRERRPAGAASPGSAAGSEPSFLGLASVDPRARSRSRSVADQRAYRGRWHPRGSARLKASTAAACERAGSGAPRRPPRRRSPAGPDG